jgi:TubC N-terminal docking domain
MNAESLTTEAAQLGITLWVKNGAIRYWPKSAMTPKLVAAIRANRPQVLLALSSRSAAIAGSTQTKFVGPGGSQSRGLIGNGFPPRQLQAVPDSILAPPTVLCPECGVGRVLAELRKMTSGQCYSCWEKEVRS